MSNQIRYSWDEPAQGQIIQDRIEISGWFFSPDAATTTAEIYVELESTRYRCEHCPRDLTSLHPGLSKTDPYGFRCQIPLSGPARSLPLRLIVVINRQEEKTIVEREVFWAGECEMGVRETPSQAIPEDASDLSRDVYFRDGKARTTLCKPFALGDYLSSLKNRHGVQTILDFGCGHGDIVRYLRSRGFETTGAEPSKFLVESLRLPDVAHPTQMELGKGQYDVVLSLDFLTQQNPHRVKHYLRLFRELRPKFVLLSVRTYFSAEIPSNCLRMIEWWRSRFNRFGFDIVDDCLSEQMRSLPMESRQPSANILRMSFRRVSEDHNLDVAFFLLRPSESAVIAETDYDPQMTSGRLNFGCFAHNAWKYYETFLPLVDPRNVRAFCAPYLASRAAHHITISRLRSWGIEPKPIDLNHELLESGNLGPDDIWISNIEGDYDYGMLFAGSFTITAAMCGARTVHIVHGCSGWETKPTGCFSDKIFVYSLADIEHFCGPSFFAPDTQRLIVDRRRFVPTGRPEYDPYFKEPDFTLTDLFGEFYGSFKTKVLIPTNFGREDFSPTIELICQMVESFPDVLFIVKTSAME
ncbi:MAG: methyltransferase domain-containing protein, partial [bacterium]